MVSQTLDGSWELRQVGTEEVIPASVPGCVHLDLMSAKKMDDPFYGDNEYRVAWVHQCDWAYSRKFSLDGDIAGAEKVFLECEGLDTLSRVELNGKLLDETDNMYVSHRFDVTDKLAKGENFISIELKSAVNYCRSLVSADTRGMGDSIPGSTFVRKAPCQFGWDWGPKIPTSGIWRSVRLSGYKIARIDDLRITQKHDGGKVSLDIEAALEGLRDGPCSLVVKITDPDGLVTEHDATVVGQSAKCSISIANPKLWWPNGYGAQPLYRVEAILACDGEVLHTASHRIGLRTLELCQDPDEWGTCFTFKINGVPIFCKGADWVPADQFPARITDAHYRHLISSCATANMNMLRVWGGGFYEDDRFYDLCDELGILVWQDFMFACAHYPVDEPFLDNVRREVEFQVKRLRNRTCMALWCGNNEGEWGATQWWADDRKHIRQAEYAKLFHEVIPEAIDKTGTNIPYWPSSPSCGIEGYPNNDINSQDAGDGHYWEAWHGRKPFTEYRKQFHRFMSEFGFESLPAFETVKSFASDDELNMTSYVMECHQKNSAGNGLILYYMAQTFQFPKNFEMMCYTSQLLQAEAMRYGVEHWRRNRGRCMGALYWQLDDTWPVCSWASIDYFGRWKATQYAAKRFFAPLLLSVCEEGKTARVHVTNDTLQPVDVEIKWSLERLDGTVLRSGGVKLTANRESDTCAAELDFTSELEGDAVRQSVLVCEMTANGEPAGLTMTPFVPSKHLELPKAKLSTAAGSDEEGSYVVVATDKSARYVFLEIPGRDVIFSDNYFDLPAGRSVTVRIDGDVEPSELKSVRAYSLYDSY